jgi:hypothetical protein
MIVVKRGSVQHNGKFYGTGEILPNMKVAESKRLIALGICEEIAETAEANHPKTESSDTEGGEGNLNIDPEGSIKAGGK